MQMNLDEPTLRKLTQFQRNLRRITLKHKVQIASVLVNVLGMDETTIDPKVGISGTFLTDCLIDCLNKSSTLIVRDLDLRSLNDLLDLIMYRLDRDYGSQSSSSSHSRSSSPEIVYDLNEKILLEDHQFQRRLYCGRFNPKQSVKVTQKQDPTPQKKHFISKLDQNNAYRYDYNSVSQPLKVRQDEYLPALKLDTFEPNYKNRMTKKEKVYGFIGIQKPRYPYMDTTMNK